MTGFKQTTFPRQSLYNSFYVNPLTDPKHGRSCSEGGEGEGGGGGAAAAAVFFSDNKENAVPNKEVNAANNIYNGDKENAAPTNGSVSSLQKQFSAVKSLSTNGSVDVPKQVTHFKSLSTGRVLKPSSLQFCMQMNEPDRAFGSNVWDPTDSENSSSLKIWDYSDSEAAPASSWSTLPNRYIF